jgi:hypothetical protein
MKHSYCMYMPVKMTMNMRPRVLLGVGFTIGGAIFLGIGVATGVVPLTGIGIGLLCVGLVSFASICDPNRIDPPPDPNDSIGTFGWNLKYWCAAKK